MLFVTFSFSYPPPPAIAMPCSALLCCETTRQGWKEKQLRGLFLFQLVLLVAARFYVPRRGCAIPVLVRQYTKPVRASDFERWNGSCFLEGSGKFYCCELCWAKSLYSLNRMHPPSSGTNYLKLEWNPFWSRKETVFQVFALSFAFFFRFCRPSTKFCVQRMFQSKHFRSSDR